MRWRCWRGGVIASIQDSFGGLQYSASHPLVTKIGRCLAY